MPNNPSIPMTVYKVPNPLEDVSELYTVYADVLPSATDPKKRWIVHEIHGYWDENETDPNVRKFKNRATTLSPNDPKHCVTLEEALELVNKQVLFRAKSGFKYMRMLDRCGPPHKLYEVTPNGTYREMPLPELNPTPRTNPSSLAQTLGQIDAALCTHQVLTDKVLAF
jgi:hypothetical protein